MIRLRKFWRRFVKYLMSSTKEPQGIRIYVVDKKLKRHEFERLAFGTTGYHVYLNFNELKGRSGTAAQLHQIIMNSNLDESEKLSLNELERYLNMARSMKLLSKM